MRTTIYLVTPCGLAVIQGCDESWVGEVCLNDKQIHCVTARIPARNLRILPPNSWQIKSALLLRLLR
jgi:hypothetical protein